MKTTTDPRHRHRVRLMQHLYSSAVQNRPDTFVTLIWEKLSTIDALVAKAAPEWPIDKLNPVDLAILRLAIFELTVDKSTPYKVIIDEAIELAKEFGGENSSKFINGALGNIVQDPALGPFS
ncbi:transcription antitermination factor NusB [Candidatus Amesbacteria bacterium RIFOXYB1_FULL_44_23]|uniref:Transcription antitermination protein NusB n=1 Tax=Candidatus Amesbacteria bacterium RIFOXYB1_FULL_44_23 TaxID=1797263 RepID=A0A1F4ZWA5_9BACT|nr:MAG: transcription antitermination factor NusB [Candidatus Amesbacteria bacterium RIFOXYB1_FULL_44_23]